MGIRAFTVTSLVFSLLVGALAEQCGSQAGGAECPGGLCCSQWGWCGTTDAYCCVGCQSQCNCGGGGGGGGGDDDDDDCGGGGGGGDDDDSDGYLDIIPKSTFEEMLMHRNDLACPANGFYTYEAFIKAAKAFPDFATQGDDDTRKRELAAFFGQTSHETTGGWPDAPDGPYAWGYCFNEEIGCPPPPAYCDTTNLKYPCAPGKSYCGRGPMQLSWNYNYGQCGDALGLDLLNKPECVKKDPVLAFKTAIWFWMTPQAPKPSCHDVITEKWIPSNGDLSAGRVPGYGVITNIINGGLECGIGKDTRVENRIGFYKRYCDIFGIDYGDNLDCSNQRPFGSGLLVNTI